MPTTFPDLVVVVPGLIGSVLSKDGKPIWGFSAGALWRVIAGSALEQLELNGPDDERDDLGDGVTATGLVENIQIVPGLWKQGGYSILAEQLVSELRRVCVQLTCGNQRDTIGLCPVDPGDYLAR